MTDTSPAPLEWRIAAGHRLVELNWTESDLVDIWVMNIWKEHGDLPPVEAVNKWYSVYEASQAQIEAGTHPFLSKEIVWAKDYELAWGELVFGEYDFEATLDDAYEIYKTEGHRSPKEVARAHFEGLPEVIKARYVGRERPSEQPWVPPTV